MIFLSFPCIVIGKLTCFWTNEVHAADSFDFNEELLIKPTFIVANFVI